MWGAIFKLVAGDQGGTLDRGNEMEDGPPVHVIQSFGGCGREQTRRRAQDP
jgi:hypothetical protein